MSDNGKIKYTFTAEDKISDVVGHVKGSLASLKAGAAGTFAAFRSGGLSGAAEHLKGLELNGLAATGVMKLFAIATNPVALGLMGLKLACMAVGAAFRAVGAAIGEAAAFQKHTFDLKALEGSYGAARQAMLALTEGKQAVDAEFGTDAVVKAYKTLHTYSGGALASANMVNLLGNRAKFTGKSIEEMGEIAGKAWQAIAAGNGLGMAKEQLGSGMRIDASVIKELEDMQKAGASAGEVWLRLRDEIEKTSNTIADSEGSVESLDERIADAKGTISTGLGEMFLPLSEAWKTVSAEILDGFAEILGRGKEVRDELAETARAREKDVLDKAAAAEASAQLEKKWGEARERQTQRREDQRLEALPMDQVLQEAATAQKEGRVADWEKLTQLYEKKLAEAIEQTAAGQKKAMEDVAKKREELARAEADATEKGKTLAEQQQQDVDQAAGALANRKDEIALEGMSTGQRAAEYERRSREQSAKAAAIRGGKADGDLSKTDLAAAIKADLAALDFKQLAKGERKTEAEKKASEDKDKADKDKAEADKKTRLKDVLASSRERLADLSKGSTSSLGTEQRFAWMANVRGGRTPDEEIAENTREIAQTLKEIKKAGGIQ